MKQKKGERAGEGGQVVGEVCGRVWDQGRWKEVKVCCTCGRQFTWRKKWERCWAEVTTCSDRCNKERKRAKKSGDQEQL